MSKKKRCNEKRENEGEKLKEGEPVGRDYIDKRQGHIGQ